MATYSKIPQNTVRGPPDPFFCCVCVEHYDGGPRRTPLPNQAICSHCIATSIRPQFIEPFNYEHKYPVKFGSAILQVRHYAGWLYPDFVQMYERKEMEYSIPYAKRAYCKNKVPGTDRGPPPGAFCVEGPNALTEEEVEELIEKGEPFHECGAILHPGLVHLNICYECKAKACPRCGEVIKTMKGHKCSAEEDRLEALENAEGEDKLKKGKDFQLCPRCKTPCELRDGCNAMRCQMFSEEFCFICGEGGLKDHARNPHWGSGKGQCPKWNQPK